MPDLSGYITEGQIVLDRELSQKGIYPPVAGLPSLSRLMKDGIGPGMTREDHKELASQLFAAYSRVKSIRSLAAVIGEEELSDLDKSYLAFGDRFEREFLAQGEHENRSIDQTLDIWAGRFSPRCPRTELYRIRRRRSRSTIRPPRQDGRESRDGALRRSADKIYRSSPSGSSLSIAREGFELLEQKREILVMELMRMVEEVKLLERDLDKRVELGVRRPQADAGPRGT